MQVYVASLTCIFGPPGTSAGQLHTPEGALLIVWENEKVCVGK
jgi:hypothetical protein